MVIDPYSGAVQVLQKTQPWVRVASMVGFLLSGVMAFLGVDATLGGISAHRLDPAPFLLVYLAFSLVFMVLAVYLHKYASRIGVFVAQGHNVQLEAALEAQRKFWKLSGLFALVSLALLTLAAGLSLM